MEESRVCAEFESSSGSHCLGAEHLGAKAVRALEVEDGDDDVIETGLGHTRKLPAHVLLLLATQHVRGEVDEHRRPPEYRGELSPRYVDEAVVRSVFEVYQRY